MIYWQNRILTNVKIALGNNCKTVVSSRNSSEAVFPACLVQVVQDAATAEDLDCDGEENAVFCGVQTEIYSKKSLSDAINLIAIVNRAMYQMGFKRREGPRRVSNVEQPDIYRVAARYVRTIGDGDVIEKFSEE